MRINPNIRRVLYHSADFCSVLQLKKSNQPAAPAVKVKISGDGARMSHSSSLFVCSFSILDEGQHVLSSAGNINLFL